MNELYELTERHVAGEATPAEEARLYALLQDRGARAAFVRHVTLMAGVRGTCQATEQEAAELQSMKGPDPVRRTVRWFPRVMALAATLAMIAGGVWWFAPGASLGVRVAEVVGAATIEDGRWKTEDWGAGSAGSKVNGLRSNVPAKPVVVGMELRQGDRVVVPEGGEVALKYNGEATTLALHYGVAQFGAAAGGKRVKLLAGLLVGDVAPQAVPFRLETTYGVAEVLGTRFSLGAYGGQTTLAVREGHVALSRKGAPVVVGAGETAVAEADGVRTLLPADAWLQELLVRAETAPWDAVDFGKGAFALDNWRMDARGSPAERLLWNVDPDLEKGLGVAFDAARWKRGVVTGRLMLLGKGMPSPVLPPGGQNPDPQMTVFGMNMRGANREANLVNLLFYTTDRAAATGGAIRFTEGRRITDGVWQDFAVYFDLQAEGQPLALHALWPEDHGCAPRAEVWRTGKLSVARNASAGFGLLAAPDLRLVVKGLKFVPLGADMPQPPAGLVKEE